MATRARVVKIAAATVVLLAVLSLLLIVGRRSVLVRLEGSTDSEHGWYLLNPLRDRGPERVADKLLGEIQDGRCPEVSLRLTGKVDPSCSRDTELRVVSWRLRARDDKTPSSTTLLYEVKRDFGPKGIRGGDPYWVNLQRQGDGSWKVVSIERWF
jgi:hypothetical protein